MENLLKRTWAEIDLDHLAYNIGLLRTAAGAGKKLMAVVKADAYGHGDQMIAKELAAIGINRFAVSNLEEAIALRQCGISGQILILGATPAEYASLLSEYAISQTVFSADYAKELNTQAEKIGKKLRVHLKLDTGMGRIGFICRPDYQEKDAVLETLRCKYLEAEGIFSHFSVADELDEDALAYSDAQQDSFAEMVRFLQKNGADFQDIHLQNSAGIMRHPVPCCNMVRMGIAMYGLSPSRAFQEMLPLKPLMELKTTVSMVKEVPAGTAVSYGRRFIAGAKTRVATVPVGYADGYHRALSGKGYLLLHGKRANILGSICMDQLMIDVTDIPETRPGDTATLFGRSGDAFLSVDTLAELAGTISYELVCAVSRRVPRVYFKSGRPVKVVDYLIKRS